jgi:hypothetical protein
VLRHSEVEAKRIRDGWAPTAENLDALPFRFGTSSMRCNPSATLPARSENVLIKEENYALHK